MNAVDSSERFPEAGAGRGAEMRGRGVGIWGGGSAQHPAGGVGGRFDTSKGSGGDRRWVWGSHPEGSELGHGAPRWESLN